MSNFSASHRMRSYRPYAVTSHIRPWHSKIRILIVLPILAVASCSALSSDGETPASVAYERYVPPLDANIQISFEYPSGWIAPSEEGDSDFAILDLCEPITYPTLEPPATPGTVRILSTDPLCDRFISIAATPAGAAYPDLETWISTTLNDLQATSEYWGTSDYAVLRQTVAVDGREAIRIRLCYTPAEGGNPPPPGILVAVYFQAEQQLYEISTVREAERPCNPAVEFPEFEHLLQTLKVVDS